MISAARTLAYCRTITTSSHFSHLTTGLLLFALITSPAHSLRSEPPFELKTLRLSQQSAAGGSQIVGVVTLTRRAPALGLVVRLRSSDPSLASVPKSVRVPNGRKSAPFFLVTRPVSSAQKITLTAIYAETKTTVLTLHPPGIAEVTLTPDSVTGGDNSIGAVRMEAPPGKDTEVELTCDAPSVTIQPDHAVLKKGQTRLEFSVITTSVKKTATVKITAKANDSSSSASLSITP